MVGYQKIKIILRTNGEPPGFMAMYLMLTNVEVTWMEKTGFAQIFKRIA